MPNRAHEHDKDLTNKTRRLRLEPRAKPYFTTVEQGVTLGYVRKPTGCGHWVRREAKGREISAGGFAYPVYEQTRLGLADDIELANGKDILSYDQARKKAMVRVATSPLTVKDAIDLYIRELKAEKGEDAAEDAKQRLDLHVVPVFGNRRIIDLKLSALNEWKRGLVSKDYEPQRKWTRDKAGKKTRKTTKLTGVSPSTANRIIANFRAALNLAFRENTDTIGTDREWRMLEGFETKKRERARQDHFSESQALLLIEKARESDPYFADLLEAGFYTGARYGELTILDVKHFNAERRQIEIPKGKTGGRVTVLTAEGISFFKRVAEGKSRDDILLPRADGERWAKNHQQKPIKAALKAAELPTTATFYAMRHTYISRAIERGMPLMLIADNVGTSVRMIEAHYWKHIQDARAHLIESTAPVLRPVLTVVKNEQTPEAA